MVNCFVDVAPERDVTVTITVQRPTMAVVIFVLDTLQSFDDDVAVKASTDIPVPVVNPTAAAAFTKVIDAPRFIDGEPTMLIGIDTVVAIPFLGVIFIFTMHFPGAIPVIFAPDVLHKALDAFEIDPVDLDPAEIDIPEALISFSSDDVLPVLIEAVLGIDTETLVGAVVVGIVVLVVVVVVGVAGVASTA